MADISLSLPYVLVNEGGYVNNPNDNGGPTNRGITQHDLSDLLGREASISDVQNITMAQVSEIYRKNYWNQMSLDKVLDQGIATAIFDMGVLCGTRTAPKWAQDVCGVPSDGLIGPQSLAALNKIDHSVFIPKFQNRAHSYFVSIADAHPRQRGFLRGWLDRVSRMSTLTSVAPPPNDYHSSILSLAGGVGCPLLGARLVSSMKAKFPGHSPSFVTIFDVSKDADHKRLHILDIPNHSVLSITCGIGAGSDPQNTGRLQRFSNESGSNCTSEGFFRYAEIYLSAKHGQTVKMDGQDPTNSNMRNRAILTHTASYVSECHAGRTNGCQGVSEAHHSDILKLANGSFGFIGKES